MTKYDHVGSTSDSNTQTPGQPPAPTPNFYSIQSITCHKLNGQNYLHSPSWCLSAIRARKTSYLALPNVQLLLLESSRHGTPRTTCLCHSLSIQCSHILEKTSCCTNLPRKYGMPSRILIMLVTTPRNYSASRSCFLISAKARTLSRHTSWPHQTLAATGFIRIPRLDVYGWWITNQGNCGNQTCIQISLWPQSISRWSSWPHLGHETFAMTPCGLFRGQTWEESTEVDAGVRTKLLPLFPLGFRSLPVPTVVRVLRQILLPQTISHCGMSTLVRQV